MPATKNNFLLSVMSFLFFASGVTAALMLVYNFGSQKPVPTDKPAKDTVFVKLVDQVLTPVNNPGRVAIDSVKTIVATTRPVARITGSSIDSVQLPQQSGRKLPANAAAPLNPKAFQANADALSKAVKIKRLLSPEILATTFISLLVLLLGFLAKKDRIIHITRRDIDPPVLQRLFQEFNPQISQLRNPRKILRFMNLVKYHYYFLARNKIDDYENAKKMMWLLLGIHNEPSLVNIEVLNPNQLADPAWFLQRIKDKTWFTLSGIQPSDEKLMMIVLKLNVDMGS